MTVFLINFLTEVDLNESLSTLLYVVDFALFGVSFYIAIVHFIEAIAAGIDTKQELLRVVGFFITIIILGCLGLLGLALAFVIWFGVEWVRLPNE